MNAAYIVDGVRTPIGSFAGSLAGVRTDDLAAFVLKALADKNPQLDLTKVADVVLGCANQAGEDNRNVARMALLLAGLPVSIPGETVNRLCASGLSAVTAAARAIQVGEGDLIIAGGVENMTRGPWVMSKTSTAFGRDMQLFDSSFGWRFIHPKMQEIFGTEAMGETAENLAERDGISREDQDLFAFNSQQKAKRALDAGRFALEIQQIALPASKGNKSDEVKFLKHDEFLKHCQN